jgi:TctA family transporter
MIEDNPRVGLTKTGGDMTLFFTRPISLVFIILIALIFSGGYVTKLLKIIFGGKKTK